jgi:tripartite ATP-independent transporter DctP family solute receptor
MHLNASKFRFSEERTMKRFVALLLAVLMVFAVVGCTPDEPAAPAEPNEEAGNEENVEPVLIQIAYGNNPGEPIDLAANEWARLIEERSNGSMKVEVYPSAQLGSKSDVIDQMLAGDNVITLADGAFLADRGAKDLGIMFAPYVFESWDDVWRLVESDWFADQAAIVEDQGMKVLTANWIYGDRHTLTVDPVTAVTDLEGMKIRVPDNNIQIKGMEVLGATPTPMAFGDIYTALQQGVVDGVENPLGVLYAGKFYEVAKNLILDAHVKNLTLWIGGTAMYDSLTPEQQQILMETGDEAGLFNNGIVDEANDEALAALEAEGVIVHEIDITEFQEAAMKFYEIESITKDWSPDLYNTVKAAMQE